MLLNRHGEADVNETSSETEERDLGHDWAGESIARTSRPLQRGMFLSLILNFDVHGFGDNGQHEGDSGQYETLS